jgi:hypothetical protein
MAVTGIRPLRRSTEHRPAAILVLILAALSAYVLLRPHRGASSERRAPIGEPPPTPREDESELLPIGLGLEEKGA